MPSQNSNKCVRLFSALFFCGFGVSCSSEKKSQAQDSQSESWFSNLGKKEDLYFKTRKEIEDQEKAITKAGGQAKTVYKCDVQHPSNERFKFTYEASTLTGEDFLADLDCRVLSECHSYFRQIKTPHECMQMTKQCFWEVTDVKPKVSSNGQSNQPFQPFNSERRYRSIPVGQGGAKASQQRNWGRWGQGPGCTQYYDNTGNPPAKIGDFY